MTRCTRITRGSGIRWWWYGRAMRRGTLAGKKVMEGDWEDMVDAEDAMGKT